MLDITVVIITKNEEARIRRVLSSVRPFAAAVVIVDDGSTDRTREIAEQEFKARVFVRPLAGDFAGQRNFGADQALTAWVLALDADEVVPPQTLERIRGLEEDQGLGGFSFKRLNHLGEEPLRWSAGRDRKLFLYRRDQGRFKGVVHEKVELNGRIVPLDEEIWHFPADTVHSLFLKCLAYTETEAEAFCRSRAAVSERELFSELVWKSLRRFWKLYVKNKGYKDGSAGLAWSVVSVIGQQIHWLKVREKARARKILVP